MKNKVITASQLRADIYKILDEVLRDGSAISIERKGHVLKIVPERAPDKLSNLIRRNVIVGDPEDILDLDWSKEWKA